MSTSLLFFSISTSFSVPRQLKTTKKVTPLERKKSGKEKVPTNVLSLGVLTYERPRAKFKNMCKGQLQLSDLYINPQSGTLLGDGSTCRNDISEHKEQFWVCIEQALFQSGNR